MSLPEPGEEITVDAVLALEPDEAVEFIHRSWDYFALANGLKLYHELRFHQEQDDHVLAGYHAYKRMRFALRADDFEMYIDAAIEVLLRAGREADRHACCEGIVARLRASFLRAEKRAMRMNKKRARFAVLDERTCKAMVMSAGTFGNN